MRPVIVTEEVQENRMDICRLCDRYDSKFNMCKECGCFLALKVKFTSMKCPLNHW